MSEAGSDRRRPWSPGSPATAAFGRRCGRPPAPPQTRWRRSTTGWDFLRCFLVIDVVCWRDCHEKRQIKFLRLPLACIAVVTATTLAPAAIAGFSTCDSPSGPAAGCSEKLAQSQCCKQRRVGRDAGTSGAALAAAVASAASVPNPKFASLAARSGANFGFVGH